MAAAPTLWREKRYNNYNHYLRTVFGKKVHKVSLHGGFTCPNRDGSKGYGGCVYCNNDSFVPQYIDAEMSIKEQMDVSVPFINGRYNSYDYIAYFQAYSNTYAEIEHLKKLYQAALDYPGVIGLDIGTRSDCVDDELLGFLAKLNEKTNVTIEYGIESCHDSSLDWMNRGHDFESIIKAVERTRAFGLTVGGHIIMGFPVEDHDMMVETGLCANDLKLDFLKIHQLHIVKGTKLAHEYQKKPFPTFELDDYVKLVIDIIERLDPEIVIQRVFGDSPDDLLIAPRWGHTIPELLYRLDQQLEQRDTWQGKLFNPDEMRQKSS